MAHGYASSSTEAISLGQPDIQCPNLPDIPRRVQYPASFVNGDVPVLCGGDDDDSSCYWLVNDGQEWLWQPLSELNEARRGAGFAQMDQDWFMAGILTCIYL